jgi:hypothetical protein
MRDVDPTLYGDYEIPWVPLSPRQEIESDRADITFEEFFQFVELNPSMRTSMIGYFCCTDIYVGFPSEPALTEPSFELPQGNGVNDSYRTYIFQVCKDPNTQRSTIEEIFDSYGSHPSNDIWPASLTQGWSR